MTCLNAAQRGLDNPQEPEKSMMPTARKCYIVLPATPRKGKDTP
jgi:hypothetical protein